MQIAKSDSSKPEEPRNHRRTCKVVRPKIQRGTAPYGVVGEILRNFKE